MNVHYLINSSGDWIYLKIGKNIFNTNGAWIGWLPWGDDDVVTAEGKYLGTICGNRIFYFVNKPYCGYPGYPGYPRYSGYPSYPGFARYSSLPSNAKDIVISQK